MSSQIETALRSHVGMATGINRRIKCPACGPERKNKADKTLSVKREDDALLWHCWHCEESGRISLKEAMPTRAKAIVKQPETKPLTKLAINYLKSRKISQATAERYGVKSAEAYFKQAGRVTEALVFPYTNAGQVYACKIRSIELKDHLQTGSCQTLWGLDLIEDMDSVTIVEGELDALAAYEAGIINVVSVPGGAPSQKPVDVENDRRFQFLVHAEAMLNEIDNIYLAGDKDKPGEIMIEEIARRLGKHKCWRVSWPKFYKDANATLIGEGKEAVKQAWDEAERFPVAGLYEPSTFFGKVDQLYLHGAGKGKSTGYYEVDNYFTIVTGSLTVVTGVPQSGKSEFLDQLAVKVADREDWPVALISPENEPDYHIVKLAQKRVGKHFFVGSENRMTKEELEAAKKWINQKFVFGYQADGSLNTIASIIERLKVAVIRNGIRMAVVDPVNYIDMPNNVNETKFVSDMLSEFRAFASSHDVALFLVAHPQKLYRDKDGKTPIPTGYDVSGSAHFFNKADQGLTIHRPKFIDDPEEVEVHVWKCRHQWAGKRGVAKLRYDERTTCYVER